MLRACWALVFRLPDSLLYPGLVWTSVAARANIAQREDLQHASTSSSWAGSSGSDEDGVLRDRTRVSPDVMGASLVVQFMGPPR